MNILFKGCIGEELMNPILSYTDMKTKYSIEVVYLRHQSDHITPEKINYAWNMMLILKMQGFI